MILSKQNIKTIKSKPGLVIPDEKLFALPERVVQFGTGVLLRGLPDYFIDKANRQDIFNGRIVVVKSTTSGGTDAFDQQDGLYTLCVRGIENGNTVEENIVNSSVSRVLSAISQWNEILCCASNPDLQVIISNTTEVGIVLDLDDDLKAAPPRSFPVKLLAFLYKRYRTFNGDPEKGLVIIPTELIPDNGEKLEAFIEELAHQNNLEYAFINWLENANFFCNSLVDRIVPGKLPATMQSKVEKELGYTDELMIMSETFCLWAIESDKKKVQEVLSFCKADPGVVIAADIDKFRELKLRLLNGSHTFTCALAILLGFTTVKQAMADNDFLAFITNLMLDEIVPAIVSEKVSREEGLEFSSKVLDRYKNPFIEHWWLSISLTYSLKMKMRNVPVLLQHYEKTDAVPQHMALGFAAYLLFINKRNESAGELASEQYVINDDRAALLHEFWSIADTDKFVEKVLKDKNLWETDLTVLPGFSEAVAAYLISIQKEGALAALKKIKVQKRI